MWLEVVNNNKSDLREGKKNYLSTLGRFVKRKTVTSELKTLPLTSGLGQHFQDLGLRFKQYGPPRCKITYMYPQSHFVLTFADANKIYRFVKIRLES